MTKNQSVRLLIVSLVGIALLTLIGGIRTMSAGIELSRQTLAQSLDQELLSLSAAASASVQSLRFQLLDVMKAEMSERHGHALDVKPTRAFLNSSFAAVALLEYADSEWKIQWVTTSPQIQAVFGAKELRAQMSSWDMQSSHGLHFQRLPDVAGTPLFASLMPLVKGTSKLIAVGVLQPSQFMLPVSAAQNREVKVIDDKGFALALNHPAYLGTSLRRQSFVGELLGLDDLSLKKSFENEQGHAVMAAGQRLPESNLFVIVEAPMPSTLGWSLSHWIFLLLTAAAGVALTWFALKKFFAESLLENEQLSQQVSQLRQQMAKSSAPAPVARGLPRDVDFVPSSVMPSPEEKTAASASGSGEDLWVEAMGIAAAELADRDQEESGCKVGPLIRGAVEKLERRFAGLPIQVEISGVDGLRGPGEEMPMKTALEEVLKNAFEAVAESPEKKITVYGEKLDGFNRITIRDSGPGISPENLKKVFEPFFTTKESGGASRGLGLNVVRRVVEELQGRVQIFSEGQGARVEIELPHDVNKGLPHQPVAHDTEFGALDLDFDEIEKKFSKPLPSVNVRKPKVRTLN